MLLLASELFPPATSLLVLSVCCLKRFPTVAEVGMGVTASSSDTESTGAASSEPEPNVTSLPTNST